MLQSTRLPLCACQMLCIVSQNYGNNGMQPAKHLFSSPALYSLNTKLALIPMPRSTSQLGAGLYAAALSMTHRGDLVVQICHSGSD